MNSFISLLGTYRVNNGKYNYISMSDPKGKFNIPDDKLKEFIIKYHDYVFNQNKKCSLLETPNEQSSLKVDLDLRYNCSKKRIYTEEHIKKLCKLYMKHIEKYVSFNDEDKERLCFITEKKKPIRDKNTTKDGIHIMFPYIICNPEIEYLIREKVIDEINDIVFNDIELTNDPEDIVDKSIINKGNWFVYGGSKDSKKEPYLLTNVYKCYNDKLELYGCSDSREDEESKDLKKYSSYELIDLISIKNNNNIEPVLINDETLGEINKIKLKYKLDNNYNNMTINDQSDNGSDSSEIVARTSRSKVYRPGRTARKTCNNINIIKMLVNCLSPERASAYDSWIKVGWSLYNIHNTDSSLRDIWIEWSKKGSGYENQTQTSIDDMKEKWCKMQNKDLGEGSLRFWAKQDNIKQYEELLYFENKEQINELIKRESLDIEGLEELSKELKKEVTATSIAKILFNMYKDEFKLVDTRGKGSFYHYEDHRWSLICENTLLRQKIIDLEDIILSYFKNLNKEKKEQINFNTEHIKKILKTIGKLNSTSFKENIMKESIDVFYNQKESKKFMESLDANVYLIGFENGIFDLREVGKKNGSPFRDGVPEDMVTMSTGIDYIPYEEIEGTLEEKEINDFLDQVFVNTEIKEYVMTHLASVLCGSTKDERFHFWSGSGGNGKSKVIELLGMCLGEYFCNLPVTLLTQKRSKSNEANPDLAITKGKRFAVLQEPEGDSEINAGILKEMTGGDKITARELYKMPVTFKPQFKLILTCNEKPKLDESDGGIWRRVRLIEFESRFMDNPDPKNPLQFKIDYELSEKFDDWKEPFMSILLNKYYKLYLDKGLKEPDIILEYTRNYKDDPCEHYNKFVKDSIITQEGEKLKIGDAWNVYLKWLDDEGKPKGPKTKFLEYMDKKFGHIRPWQNITIPCNKDEEDNDDMNDDM